MEEEVLFNVSVVDILQKHRIHLPCTRALTNRMARPVLKVANKLTTGMPNPMRNSVGRTGFAISAASSSCCSNTTGVFSELMVVEDDSISMILS
jgi:hypothetical protein